MQYLVNASGAWFMNGTQIYGHTTATAQGLSFDALSIVASALFLVAFGYICLRHMRKLR